MATNPQREGYERSGWPGKGKIMTEEDFRENIMLRNPMGRKDAFGEAIDTFSISNKK